MSSTTVCVTDTSVIPFPTLAPTYTQTSNTAAGPLPHIPCRSARSSPLLSLSDTSISDSHTSKSSDSVDYALQSRSATHVRYESGSSSSSSTLSDEIRPTIIPRSKRVVSPHAIAIDSRDIFTPPTPVSTPVKPRADGRSFIDLESRKQTPLRGTSDEEETLRPFPVLRQVPFCKFGQLRLEGSAGKHAHHTSDSNVTPSRAPAVGTLDAKQPRQTIRKKSGQPVKSSLKSARRPGLQVVTDGSFAKSEPATPIHTKVVKFDSKLEHVKLFLAEQKPLAVSRDGSPTSDTSGDEFPSFIYGDGSRDIQQVKMLVPNMPSSQRKGENVALQELVLSQDQRTITGSVRVRNIAYEKWLAVRFTLDCWQTTSEVTARYDKSIEDDTFDVFTFAFRLHDIWSRIEEKTILFALRYTVAGQEYWDNNAGKNYHIKFVLAPPSEPSSAVDNETSLRDLDLRLEDLAKARSTPIPISPYRLGRSFSADHQYSPFAKSLSTRYDFASAYKTQWARSASPQPNRHTRTHTHPSGVPATAGPTVAPWSDTLKAAQTEQVTSPPRPRPQSPLSLGSPREAMEGTPTQPARSEVEPALRDSPSPSRLQDGRERHHRRGYIDKVIEGSPNLRRTPTGSPLKFDVTGKDTTTQLPRIRSYPLTAEKPGSMVNSPQQWTLKPPLSIQTASVGDGGSQEPTPYEASQSSSSSSECSRSDTNYKQFIDQFCFYTGADSVLQESSEALPRSQSASSIGHYLLSHSPPQSFSSHMRDLPARFSLDPGGSSTPTAVRT
ncbi:putative phosphatase regulatory subunit-domain-containing protein [Butyriboletus roseoflavus]|nr:putative phosphatase regulatory subunit-domain-containing protein [Butyriboletus roseoflavus]